MLRTLLVRREAKSLRLAEVDSIATLVNQVNLSHRSDFLASARDEVRHSWTLQTGKLPWCSFYMVYARFTCASSCH